MENPHIKNVKGLLSNWDRNNRKILTFITFAVNYQIGGENPSGYHTVNILLHIIASMFLFASVRILLQSPALKKSILYQEQTRFALFVSMIFLVHPIQTQAVSYVWQRSEVLSGFLYLLSYLCYLQGRVKGQNIMYFPALISFCAGLFTKGTIVTLPLLIFITEVSFMIEDRKLKQRVAAVFIIFAGLLAGLWHLRLLRLILEKLHLAFLMPRTAPGIFDKYVYTQFSVIVKYIQLSFLPIQQNLDYYWPLTQSFFNLKTILSAAVLGVIVLIAARLYKNYRLMSFGIIAFFVYLIPTSSGIAVLDPIWEHRLYLSIAGFALFITAGIFSFVRNVKYQNALIIVIIAMFSGLAFSRNTLWASPTAIYEDAVRKSPRNARPLRVLGVIFYKQGDLRKAQDLFERALALNPDSHGVKRKLGVIYMRIGEELLTRNDLQGAETILTKAVELKQGYLMPYIRLGQLAFRRQDYNRALQMFRDSMKIQLTEDANLGIGKIYLLWDEPMKAKQHFYNALNINSNSLYAQYYLGNTYMLEQNYKRAIERYLNTLKIDPSFEDAYIRGGIAYFNKRDVSNAVEFLETAIRINPRRADAYAALSSIYAALNDSQKAAAYYEKSKEILSLNLTRPY